MRRNLLKRRIREGIRRNKGSIAGWDVVVHPRNSAEIGSGPEIASELGGLLGFVNQRKEIGIGKAKHSDKSSPL